MVQGLNQNLQAYEALRAQNIPNEFLRPSTSIRFSLP